MVSSNGLNGAVFIILFVVEIYFSGFNNPSELSDLLKKLNVFEVCMRS